jgi:hypothetical protein
MTDTATRIAGPTQVPNQINPYAGSDLLPGMPVYASAAETVDKAKGDAAGTAPVAGLCLRNGASGEPVPVLFAGPLDLPTAEWDAITGGSGGLTRGSYYYLSAATAGHLTTTEPSSEGTFGIRVGLALSTTTMLIQIGDLVVN